MRTTKEDRTFYVYALLDSRKGPAKFGAFRFAHEPFYIGKGTRNRFAQHFSFKGGELIHDSSNLLKSRVIKKIYSETNELPDVVIKRSKLTEDEAFALEKRLIKLIGRRDLKTGPLTNRTDGGDGTSALLVKKSTRLKISEASKRFFENLTDEEYAILCMNMSISAKNWYAKNPSEKWLKKRKRAISEGLLNLSYEQKENRKSKISSGNRKFWQNLTQEEKSEKVKKQFAPLLAKTQKEKDKSNRKRSKKSKQYWSNLNSPERDRLVKVWSDKRKSAWDSRTSDQRRAIGDKISQSKKAAFANLSVKRKHELGRAVSEGWRKKREREGKEQ